MKQRIIVLGLALVALSGCGETQPAAEPVASETAPTPGAIPTPTPTLASAPSPAPPPKEAPVAAKVPARLDALGTEPFWNVQVRGTTLRYATPEDQAGRTFTATRDDTSVASTFSGVLSGKPFELSIVPEKCSDGMSDTEYAFSAWLRFDGQRHHGCAREVR